MSYKFVRKRSSSKLRSYVAFFPTFKTTGLPPLDHYTWSCQCYFLNLQYLFESIIPGSALVNIGSLCLEDYNFIRWACNDCLLQVKRTPPLVVCHPLGFWMYVFRDMWVGARLLLLLFFTDWWTPASFSPLIEIVLLSLQKYLHLRTN